MYLVNTETYVIYVAFIYDPLHCIYVRLLDLYKPECVNTQRGVSK